MTGGGGGEFDGALHAYLRALADEPALARTFLVEVYAAGPAALARRAALQRRFAEAVARRLNARNAEQRFACEALVAGVSGLVTQWVCDGRGGELEELHEPLMGSIDAALRAAGF